ncbi:hypothetical protein PPL_05692 [Heterostelium album PN500]|uniref:Uncharacterized protein n=1 Tax=Heterostelium pallidum (strain ATCC 26659 / Pp 5 / PN500) TaxID=670386 RepID=D3BAW1_HETP5|nr:hypothetical protein PPL_05692 [Heterostelium album PN500]EFA81698.1 hypothetical protein PPL_05692 [Heterostelium album PN500]|eukprot:XP_020433815.1 hypothetical protein PPL_05692 [Heterostelium album PN500]
MFNLFNKKSNRNENYKSAEREDDDFVIVNDGVTQSGWVALNDDHQYIQQQYQQLQQQQLQQQQQQQQQQQEQQQQTNSNILPIYQIKQQQLNLDELEVQNQDEQQEQEEVVQQVEQLSEEDVPNIIDFRVVRESNPLVDFDVVNCNNNNNSNNNNECDIVVPVAENSIGSPMIVEDQEIVPTINTEPILIKTTGKSENNYASPSNNIKPYFTRTTNTSTSYTNTSPVPIRGGFTRSSVPTTNYVSNTNVTSYISTSKTTGTYFD